MPGLSYGKNSHYSQAGVALLFVLIFLQIFALSSMIIFRKHILHVKTIGAEWQKQTLRVNAENILTHAEFLLETTLPPCIIAPIDTAKITQKDLAWWQTSSCAGVFNTFQYYYVIEFLGKDNCTFLRDEKRAFKHIAYFYRIFLLVMPKKPHSLRVILQSTFLKKGLPDNACKLQPHLREVGRQEWNEFV